MASAAVWNKLARIVFLTSSCLHTSFLNKDSEWIWRLSLSMLRLDAYIIYICFQSRHSLVLPSWISMLMSSTAKHSPFTDKLSEISVKWLSVPSKLYVLTDSTHFTYSNGFSWNFPYTSVVLRNKSNPLSGVQQKEE